MWQRLGDDREHCTVDRTMADPTCCRDHRGIRGRRRIESRQYHCADVKRRKDGESQREIAYWCFYESMIPSSLNDLIPQSAEVVSQLRKGVKYVKLGKGFQGTSFRPTGANYLRA